MGMSTIEPHHTKQKERIVCKRNKNQNETIDDVRSVRRREHNIEERIEEPTSAVGWCRLPLNTIQAYVCGALCGTLNSFLNKQTIFCSALGFAVWWLPSFDYEGDRVHENRICVWVFLFFHSVIDQMSERTKCVVCAWVASDRKKFSKNRKKNINESDVLVQWLQCCMMYEQRYRPSYIDIERYRRGPHSPQFSFVVSHNMAAHSTQTELILFVIETNGSEH